MKVIPINPTITITDDKVIGHTHSKYDRVKRIRESMERIDQALEELHRD